MDTSGYHAKTREIIDQLSTFGPVWDHFLAREDGGNGRISDMFARIVLLVGDERIEVADGELNEVRGDKTSMTGWIVVVTPTRLVGADLTVSWAVNPYGEGQTTVESVPLTAVRGIRSEVATVSRSNDAPWPNGAQIRLALDREFMGALEVRIPRNSLDRTQAVAALAQRLPLS
jgi:hypothetical protein